MIARRRLGNLVEERVRMAMHHHFIEAFCANSFVNAAAFILRPAREEDVNAGVREKALPVGSECAEDAG